MRQKHIERGDIGSMNRQALTKDPSLGRPVYRVSRCKCCGNVSYNFAGMAIHFGRECLKRV